MSLSINLLNYRVVETLTALTGIKDKNFIYLGAGNKDSNEVLKLKKTIRGKQSCETFPSSFINNGFQIKIEKQETWDGNYQMSILLKHDKLPDEGKGWYYLRNWNSENFVLLYNNLKVDEEGVVLNSDEYEFVFDEQSCIFLKKDSDEFETISYLSLDSDVYETMQKTTKRTSGNCYLGKGGERHLYLGTFWRLSNETGLKTEYQLYSPTRIHKSITSVEELIKYKIQESSFSINEGTYKGRTYGFTNNKRWVNIGSKIKPLEDTFDIRDLWEYSAEKYVEEFKKPYSKYSNICYYSSIGNFFKIFTITSNNSVIELDSEKVTERTKEIAKDVLRSSIFGKLYINYWVDGAELPEGAPYSYSIRKYKEEKDPKKLMEMIFADITSDCYLHTYPALSNYDFLKLIIKDILGLNFEELFNQTLEDFKKQVIYLDQDLQTLINWKTRAKIWFSTMRENTLGQIEEFEVSKYSRISSENDLFENWPRTDTPHLRETLLKIYENGVSKSGNGVTDLEIASYGSGRNKTQLLRCTIDVEDIVDYYGGSVDNVPGEVVKELLNYKITQFVIKTNNKDFKIKK